MSFVVLLSDVRRLLFFIIILLMEVILNYVTISPFRMGSPELVFEVHYGGRFDGYFGCKYVGGEVAIHHETYDREMLSFFEIEGILKPYGYNFGDLTYFKDPVKSLVNGLYLITSDHNVLYWSSCHISHYIVHLYIVSFGEGGGNEDDDDEEDDYEDEDDHKGRVDLHDPWWADKLSDDKDLFDVDMDVGCIGDEPSTQVGSQYDGNGEGGDEGDDDDNNDEGSDDNSHGQQAEDHSEGHDVDGSQSGGKFMRSFEDGDDDGNNSKIGRRDILESPYPSGEDDKVTHAPNYDFHAVDLSDLVFNLKMKFPDIKMFKEAIKVYNVIRRKTTDFFF
jgi:hypothetical protein